MLQHLYVFLPSVLECSLFWGMRNVVWNVRKTTYTSWHSRMNILISHHINPDFSPPTERSGSEGLRFCRNYQMEELPASHDSLALRKGNNIRCQPGNDEAVGSGFWNHLGKVRLEAPTLKPTSQRPASRFLPKRTVSSTSAHVMGQLYRNDQKMSQTSRARSLGPCYFCISRC